MNREMKNQYEPDYVVHPGETLKDALDERDMTQVDFARRTGRPLKTINEIVQGKSGITPDTALQMERVLGIPARFWNNLQAQYEEAVARKEERDRLAQHLEWLKEIPIREMCKFRWIRCSKDPMEQLEAVLAFFGVASPEQWRVLWEGADFSFRRSPVFQSRPVAVAAWLRQGEKEGQQIRCANYDPSNFREALTQIRPLTREDPEVFQPEVIRLCAAAGVAAVFVPELPKTGVSGAARWMAPNKALILVNLRYKRDDQLWFSFFHEAAHILLHGKRDSFLDVEGQGSELAEEEANRLAAEFLIPSAAMKPLRAAHPYIRDDSIIQFANDQGIAPGIVVGRLQHEKLLDYKRGNGLKRKLEWAFKDEAPYSV
jgi:HTH-type transcriptional regulator / antitoxin HigA